MSRIGKQPISLPQGVKASVKPEAVLIEGPMGKLEYKPTRSVKVSMADGKLLVEKVRNDRQAAADYGTTRARLNNMVTGVSKGWKRALELNGVGYVAKMNGATLTLAVGFSHEVNFEIPKLIKCNVSKNLVEMESCDRELLGTFAGAIRKVQPAEPYLGKGIKYPEETIRRKAGKAGKK